MENNIKDKKINISEFFEKIEKIYKLYIICKKKIIKNLNITPVETKALEFIYENNNCNQISLAKHLKINKSRATRIIKDLLSKNLVQRVKSDKDKRERCLKLTYYGEQILKKNKNLCSEFLEFSLLNNSLDSEDEFNNFNQCILKLLNKLEELEKNLNNSK